MKRNGCFVFFASIPEWGVFSGVDIDDTSHTFGCLCVYHVDGLTSLDKLAVYRASHQLRRRRRPCALPTVTTFNPGHGFIRLVENHAIYAFTASNSGGSFPPGGDGRAII